MVYLVHLERPMGTEKHSAQHYCGMTRLSIEERMQRHKTERGAALLMAAKRKGIGFKCVRVWEGGDHALELRLKASGHLKRYCPVCNRTYPQPIPEGRGE